MNYIFENKMRLCFVICVVLCMVFFMSLVIFAKKIDVPKDLSNHLANSSSGDKLSHNKTQSHNNRTFRVDYQNNQFLKDGKKFQFVSGAINYYRALPQKWRQLFRTTRAAGLNTVETYVQWTSHNPHDGEYIWTGKSNIQEFLRIAAEEDLLVILRPSPFICGEQSGVGSNQCIYCCFYQFLSLF